MSGWENGWGLEFLVFMNQLGGKPLDLFFELFAFLGGELGYMYPSISQAVERKPVHFIRFAVPGKQNFIVRIE